MTTPPPPDLPPPENKILDYTLGKSRNTFRGGCFLGFFTPILLGLIGVLIAHQKQEILGQGLWLGVLVLGPLAAFLIFGTIQAIRKAGTGILVGSLLNLGLVLLMFGLCSQMRI